MALCMVCSTSGAWAGEVAPGMSNIQAVVLGVVEGLTEYLPVSSTGHLYLAASLMGLGGSVLEQAASNAYVIAIQIGAILAVVWLYPGRIAQMVMGLMGRDPRGLRLAINTLAAFIPAAVIGLTCADLIKSYLFGIWPITAAWLAGGVAILTVARRLQERPPGGLDAGDLSVSRAFVIGMIQCLAMWPGVSRSLVTILGGTMVGLSVPAAVEFSFILGLITLGSATCYEIVKEGTGIIIHFGWISPAIGIVVAFVSAVVAVKWMVAYLTRHGLEIFGYYRIALALGVMGLILAGIL
ncbi:MAG: undecaprenyl-diphosphate phosphatase [Syntrophaceae bacterium]